MTRSACLALAVASLALFALVGCGKGASAGADVFHLDSGSSHLDGSMGTDATLDGGGRDTGTMILGGGDASTIPPPMGDGSVVPDIEPSTLQTITVTAGQMTPTVTYTATIGGQPVMVAWGVDRGNIGTVPAGPSASAVFVPSGTTGGLVDVLATLNGMTIQRQVMVLLTSSQNGLNPSNAEEQGQTATMVSQLSAGGGVGGVGGEGLGGTVTDPATLAALAAPSADAGVTEAGAPAGLTLLYPYNATVWPRGMVAPLLMWSWATNDADAVQIQLSTTSGSFAWTGIFGRPAILTTTGGPFIRHPIPQDVWDMATNTAGGATPNNTVDQLTMTLTIAKNGVGYGPVSETWTVAPGLLTGTVYYNSYGTHFVKNWTSLDKAGNSVGAAILGIRSGATAPELVAGLNSPTNAQGNPSDDTGCRVCHVVSSGGRWLITQSEQGTPGDGQSYLYDLTQTNVQASAVQMTQQGTFTWAAMLSDGSYALTNAVDPSSSNPGVTNAKSNTATSSFWQFGPMPTQQPSVSGLPMGVAAGYPSFSPDNKYVAYVDVTGHNSNVDGNIVMAQYAAATQTFSGVTTMAMPAMGQRIGYPVFLPDDSGILFETEVRSSQGDTVMVTRNGARSELWWMSTGATPTPTALATLNGLTNGVRYLPAAGSDHGIGNAGNDPQSSYNESTWDDTTLAYEPTVLPVAAGGYAWVVFTSRRLYGNQCTALPWLSWPPDYDTTNLAEATVKKLWVAAIDLNAPPGTDPSHPAFYLPAQEILAGNSRGFWVLDPCEPDGQPCQSGDQCCNGYCEPNGEAGALICSSTPPNTNCSGVSDKCTTAADCCDPTNQCINGFCAQMQMSQ